MSSTRFRVPHTLVLLFGMVLVAQALTYVLPSGAFDRVMDDNGHEEVVAGTYTRIDDAPPTAWHRAFTAIPSGFAAAQDIIFFVFLVGGAFGVLRATGAVEALIGFLLGRFGHRPGLLVGGGVFLFALGSSTIGMAEEYLPFVPILLVLARGLGFDAVTAVGILCVGYGMGYGTAAINPFTVWIAQDVAGLPQTSGLSYRLILFVIFVSVGIHHVWRYASGVKRDPSRSLVADAPGEAPTEIDTHPHFTRTHIAVLAVMTASIAVIVVGVKSWGWYLHEMGGLFLGLSVILAVVARIGADRTARTFCEGAAELSTTALLIGFARTIQVVLDDAQVVDTIIHTISAPLANMGSAGAGVGMMVFQSLCNFFIPSGSGQAYVTMPLMAPLADLVGVERQVAVLAYQFGDGFTNILVPTNAVLVGILAMAGVPYDRWVRFVGPLMLKVWGLGAVAIAVAVWMGYA